MTLVYVDAADVLARLRLQPGDRDADYVADCTTVANDLVANELRRGVTVVDPADDPADLDPVPPPVWRAALGVAIRVYRFKDAEADVAESWDGAGLRIPRDPLAGYRDLLTPGLPGEAWAPA